MKINRFFEDGSNGEGRFSSELTVKALVSRRVHTQTHIHTSKYTASIIYSRSYSTSLRWKIKPVRHSISWKIIKDQDRSCILRLIVVMYIREYSTWSAISIDTKCAIIGVIRCPNHYQLWLNKYTKPKSIFMCVQCSWIYVRPWYSFYIQFILVSHFVLLLFNCGFVHILVSLFNSPISLATISHMDSR